MSFKATCGIMAFCLLSVGLSGQNDSLKADLAFYGDVMTNAALPKHRERAGEAFRQAFNAFLQSDSPATLTFHDLPWLTVIVPSDSVFRLVTWQVEGDDAFRYYGYLLPERGAMEVIEFQDSRPLNSESATYTPEQWYGGLYYGIQPFTSHDGKEAYVLLGFDAHNTRLNRRVADILWFDGEKATLGMPVFWADTLGQTFRNRVIVEYSDAAAATMRFDREKQMLIYDHLIPIQTPEGPAMVPDGSYHGYQYNNGYWELINKVFNLKLDEPPGGRPKEAEKRDLFGRPKGS